MNLRIETYLKVTAMNWYRLCSRIVRASNSLHIEKYKSLVSLHQAQWRQNGRTAEISFFQIENLVSSNTQISTKWQFSYFDLHGVSDRTKRQKIFQDLAQSAAVDFEASKPIKTASLGGGFSFSVSIVASAKDFRIVVISL